MTSRRKFLSDIATLSLIGIASNPILNAITPPPDLFDAELVDLDFWVQPRKIEIARPQTKEKFELTYWKDGVVDEGAYKKICHILRDVQANKSTKMDPKLIDTLWAAQAFTRRYGMDEPLIITSGYRTEKTNKRLREQGIPAARQSLHVQAKAADFKLQGLHPEVLGKLVQGFGSGGVGFYFRVNSSGGGWIHADTGPRREWKG